MPRVRKTPARYSIELPQQKPRAHTVVRAGRLKTNVILAAQLVDRATPPPPPMPATCPPPLSPPPLTPQRSTRDAPEEQRNYAPTSPSSSTPYVYYSPVSPRYDPPDSPCYNSDDDAYGEAPQYSPTPGRSPLEPPMDE